MFEDFFDPSSTANSLREIYDITNYSTSVFYGINLIWPTFDLNENFERYFLSWHTEQIDVAWLIKQSKRVYPKEVLVVSDEYVESSGIWPRNVKFLTWHTIDKQISKAVKHFGVNQNISKPKFKFSSLSFRYSQYKKFITSYMLSNIPHEDMILSWHKYVGKVEDLHDHPVGFSWLDNLDLNVLTQKHQLNFSDSFNIDANSPLQNSNWNTDPYINALVNLTNESFHYSNTLINSIPVCYPSPYITEKTYKPLLSGRPFVAVGQCNTLKKLRMLGFRTDFGWNDDYDTDCGDLTRISKIFSTIHEINSYTIGDLYDMSLSAVQHNIKHIESGNLGNVCRELNAIQIQTIQDFIG